MPKNKSYQNSQWICRVREELKAGFGVEDIAIRLNCDVADVRAEVGILREGGDLKRMFKALNESADA